MSTICRLPGLSFGFFACVTHLHWCVYYSSRESVVSRDAMAIYSLFFHWLAYNQWWCLLSSKCMFHSVWMLALQGGFCNCSGSQNAVVTYERLQRRKMTLGRHNSNFVVATASPVPPSPHIHNQHDSVFHPNLSALRFLNIIFCSILSIKFQLLSHIDIQSGHHNRYRDMLDTWHWPHPYDSDMQRQTNWHRKRWWWPHHHLNTNFFL